MRAQRYCVTLDDKYTKQTEKLVENKTNSRFHAMQGLMHQPPQPPPRLTS
jgi:hypothetical protein